MKTLSSPLSRTEATLVNTWLQSKGIETPSGWISLWKFKPGDVASMYNVQEQDVVVAARRKEAQEASHE